MQGDSKLRLINWIISLRDGEWFSCKGGFSSREVVDGFACRGGLGAGVSVGSSCKWESDNGEGVVRSRVNAAQSQ